MAVVADQPIKSRKARSLQVGANAILTRPWVLFVVVTSSLVAWLFQPERTVSGLARSFALPPLDVYSDAAVRSRGWGAFIFLVILRWVTFAIIISFLVGGVPSMKPALVSLGIYLAAAFSYAIPLNLGRIFVISSGDERSSLPALTVMATPVVLVLLTWFFTYLLMKVFTTYSSRARGMVPASSVGLWTFGPQLLQASDITTVGVLLSLVILTVQAILLASLVSRLQTGP